jgi:hypothetical protein
VSVDNSWFVLRARSAHIRLNKITHRSSGSVVAARFNHERLDRTPVDRLSTISLVLTPQRQECNDPIIIGGAYRKMRRKLFVLLPLLAAACEAATQQFDTPVNITASASATTNAFSATFPAVANTYNLLCGAVMDPAGTTTSASSVTASGLVSGMAPFTYVFPSTGQAALGLAFPQCIRGFGSNTEVPL